MLGISSVRRLDFDNNGNDEFLIAYFKSGKYYVEVWGKKGDEFVSFYQDEANILKDYRAWKLAYDLS